MSEPAGLTDEKLREKAKALEVLMTAQVPLPKSRFDVAYEALRAVHDEARREARAEVLEEAENSTCRHCINGLRIQFHPHREGGHHEVPFATHSQDMPCTRGDFRALKEK